ncbi:MAG: hypothetical protein FD173_2184 [Gallionellaceae bacterium]|nr:MAG: hypothetical protein FD173_2184 [Gallionellaceae bacterium]
MSLTGLGAEMDVGQKYRADLLRNHVVAMGTNILAPVNIDVYSMCAEWHGDISSLLQKYFGNVNLLLPANIEISHCYHKSEMSPL